MGNFIVSKNFSTGKYSDEGLVTKAQVIHDSMTGNAHYPAPDPDLATLQTAITDFQLSIIKAKDGSKEDTAEKNAKRQVVVDLLRRLSYYVQLSSLGIEAIILSSGFDVNKQPGTVGPLPKPENFKVVIGGNKGSLELSCDAVDNANFYEYMYTKAPLAATSVWITKVSTRRKILVDGLTSGQQYVFKMAAGGSDANRIWTDEISSYVL